MASRWRLSTWCLHCPDGRLTTTLFQTPERWFLRTRVCVFSPEGYQLYKKCCGGGSADPDGEAPPLEAGGDPEKAKECALENSGFESEENGKQKDVDINSNTKL